MNPSSLGPTKIHQLNAVEELKICEKRPQLHWFCGGPRSIGIAVELLRQRKIIAVPTDTIYGLAGIVASTYSIERLYEIKRRDENKPLAICLSNVKHVHDWGIVDDLPPELLPTLLPGPFTVVLKRTAELNPAFNPGIDTVGIRVPDSHFIRSISEIIGPLALTSANVSNEPSSLSPSEFSELWPMLGGIFHGLQPSKHRKDELMKGSTVIDLSCPGYYKILRFGVKAGYGIKILKLHGLKPCTSS